MNDELEERWGVSLTSRSGVYTGEVVTGDPATGQRLVTGDAVNTAARLEQAAPFGEVLVGETTVALATEGVDVEAVEPVAAKGKAALLPAYRLISVAAGSHLAPRADVAMVGREKELGALLEAFDGACQSRICVLTTVLGDPGVGKTRLVAELLSRIGDRARIGEGRCLSYGEGITYWPLSQIVRQLAGISEADPHDLALRKLAVLCDGAADEAAIVERVAAAMGLVTVPMSKEELAWGFRKLFEHLGADRPLVVVLDDIQWAHPPLLEAIVHLGTLSTATPLLLICMARPQLEEDAAGWADAVGEHVAIRLEPLSNDESEVMVGGLVGGMGLPEETLSNIVASAQGNPLFLEQMLSMWQDEGTIELASSGWELAERPGRLSIPPSIQALLAARLDSLIEQERAVLERGAVVGQVFPADAVAAMSSNPLRLRIGATLDALQRRRLIRPDDASLLDDPAFAFVHLLVRDAAYAGMLRRLRAELHERFADWLIVRVGDRLSEFQEIVGYHLEQAFRNLIELGPAAERTTGLRIRAGDHLIASARRVFETNDMRAAASLFDRANELLLEDDPRLADALLSQAIAHMEAGGFDRSRSIFERGEAVADSMHDDRTRTLIRLGRIRLSLMDETTVAASDLRNEAERAAQFFRSSTTIWASRGRSTHEERSTGWRGHYADAEAAFRGGDAACRTRRRGARGSGQPRVGSRTAYAGPIEVDTGLERCADVMARASGDRLIQAFTKHCEGGLLGDAGGIREGT